MTRRIIKTELISDSIEKTDVTMYLVALPDVDKKIRALLQEEIDNANRIP